MVLRENVCFQWSWQSPAHLTHTQFKSDADSYTSPCDTQSAAKRRPAKEKEREEKPESQQVIKMSLGMENGYNIVRKWICSCRVPRGLTETTKSQDFFCIFTINGMVFKENSEQSCNILNHSAQAPASAAVQNWDELLFSIYQACLEFHRPISPSWIQQQSGTFWNSLAFQTSTLRHFPC